MHINNFTVVKFIIILHTLYIVSSIHSMTTVLSHKVVPIPAVAIGVHVFTPSKPESISDKSLGSCFIVSSSITVV